MVGGGVLVRVPEAVGAELRPRDQYAGARERGHADTASHAQRRKKTRDTKEGCATGWPVPPVPSHPFSFATALHPPPPPQLFFPPLNPPLPCSLR